MSGRESMFAALRATLERWVPDGFRDADGVWHDGPHRRDALAALDSLAGVSRTPCECHSNGECDPGCDGYAACGLAVGGKPCEREPGHQGPCLHSLIRYGAPSDV